LLNTDTILFPTMKDTTRKDTTKDTIWATTKDTIWVTTKDTIWVDMEDIIWDTTDITGITDTTEENTTTALN